MSNTEQDRLGVDASASPSLKQFITAKRDLIDGTRSEDGYSSLMHEYLVLAERVLSGQFGDAAAYDLRAFGVLPDAALDEIE